MKRILILPWSLLITFMVTTNLGCRKDKVEVSPPNADSSILMGYSTKELEENYVLDITSAYCTVFERSVEIPSFMNDDSLDIRDKGYYTNYFSLHDDFVSLRIEIMRQVENRKLLEMLANQKETPQERAKREQSRIPSSRFSNAELARLRLRALDEGIDTLVFICLPRYIEKEE